MYAFCLQCRDYYEITQLDAALSVHYLLRHEGAGHSVILTPDLNYFDR